MGFNGMIKGSIKWWYHPLVKRHNYKSGKPNGGLKLEESSINLIIMDPICSMYGIFIYIGVIFG